MLLAAAAAAAVLAHAAPPSPSAHDAPYATLPMSDPAIFFSDYNWIRTGATASTANPGAFLRASFSGGSLALLVDGTALAGQSVKLRYSVDDRSMGFILPNATAAGAGATPIALPVPALAGGRSRHTLELILYASNQQADRWHGGTKGGGGAYLVLAGLRLDGGAGLAPPPVVLPKRALVFGDSITEGTNAQLYDYDRDACGRARAAPWSC